LTQAKNKTSAISFGFYWRKAVFFGCLILVAIFAIRSVGSFKADSGDFDYAVYSGNPTSDIEVTKNGKVIVGENETVLKLSIMKDFDELRTPVIDSPGIYMDEFAVNLKLPEDIADQVKYEVLGIHGVEKTEVYVQDSRTIVYKAYGIGPSSTVSIIAKLPKGAVNYSFADKALFSLRQLGLQQWLLLSLLIPIISVIYMIALIAKQLRADKYEIPDKEIDNLPMALPPAIVGVLYRQKVTSREIAATLIDLAIRGNIFILDRERDFAFAKNNLDQRLISYEKVLLSKIFNEHVFSNREDLEKRINDHLYSKKISIFTSGLYNLTTRLGYFKVNPQQVHARYRFGGLIVFFISLGGFLLSFNYSLDYPYLSFIWVAMMVTALVITMIAQKVPIRTPLGREALSNWLAFRKFLSSKEKVPFTYCNVETFEKYLPYAIVLDCEVAWAQRFSEENFVIPKWFISSKDGFSLQDFCLSLFPIVSYISRSLAAIREPGFE
jgi:hypothetical protein